MRTPTLSLLLALAVAIPAELPAQTLSGLEGKAQLFCADSPDSAHPTKIKLEQALIFDTPFSLDGARLILNYDPDLGGMSSNGRILATAILLPASGGQRTLGKLKGVQNSANGAVIIENGVKQRVSNGDRIRWKLKLTGFTPLATGRCFTLTAGITPPAEACGPYPDWRGSDYTLPYQPGQAYVLSQGNCSFGSHRGPARHAYDFAMPMETEIVAARAGEVISVQDGHPDGTGRPDHDNHLRVRHKDGSLATYTHIRQGGARASIGDQVVQGELLALSGNSGSTSGIPHLHFQVTPCPNREKCSTNPVTFSNTLPNSRGLQLGRAYPAKDN